MEEGRRREKEERVEEGVGKGKEQREGSPCTLLKCFPTCVNV